MSDVPELRALKRLRVASCVRSSSPGDVDSERNQGRARQQTRRVPGAGRAGGRGRPAPPKKTKPAAPDAPSLASPSPPAPDARTGPAHFEVAARRPALRGLPRDNCDGDFVARLFAPHFTPASIHVPTSRRGDANVPRGFARSWTAPPPPDASPVPSRPPSPRFATIRVPRRAPRASSLPASPPPTVPTPRRFIFTRRPRDLLLPCASIRISVGASSSTDLPRTSRRRRRRACFERTGRFEASDFDPREGENDVPRRATVEFETRDAAEAAARALEGATPVLRRWTPSRLAERRVGRGDRDRDRNKSRGPRRRDGRSSRGRGRGSGRDKGRERGRGRGEGTRAAAAAKAAAEGGYVGVHPRGSAAVGAGCSIAHAHLYRR